MLDAIGDMTMVARRAAVPAVPVEDGLVMMNVERGSYLQLDDIGADIWNRLAEPCSFRALVDGLAADYTAARDTIAAGVKAWLVRMADMDIVDLS